MYAEKKDADTKRKFEVTRFFVNEGFNKHYTDALNRIEAAKSELDLVRRHIDAANLQIEQVTQKLVNVERNMHFLKKEWMITSLYQYALIKKERQDLREKLVFLKNDRIRLTHISDSISLQIVTMQHRLPSLQSKVLRLKNDKT